jgi:hypothetical protein
MEECGIDEFVDDRRNIIPFSINGVVALPPFVAIIEE